ncbi:MAG: Helicase associated domain protein [Nitrospirae bacterium]|nr:Helicase associated domain protein [Nitrospirota bacterium]
MFPILRRFDWNEIKSWDGLEKAISGLPTQQDRGEAFEEFSEALLELHKDYYQATKIWRFRNVPDEILERLGCSNRQDMGIDGMILHCDDTLTAYQSKFRLDRSDIPSQRELSTFYMVSDRADFRLIIANVEDLPRVVRERKAHGQYLVDSLLNLPEEFFASLQEYVFHEKPKVGPPLEPRPFQLQAIDAVIDGFREHSRGQAILPCGSGKTLIGKWIADRLGAKQILILVPSLALIKQTLEEWYKVRGPGFRYICICSDQSVALLHSEDGWEADPSDQDFKVSTDPRELTAFLRQSSPLPYVVFSTYQSSAVLVDGLRELAVQKCRFDLVICDEAHKVAGAAGKPFAQVLDDDKIPATKRLFMTATPRVIAPQYRKKTEEDAVPIVSMDEPDVFGPVFYRMSFAEAIQQEIISDYRVVVIGVSEQEVAELARSGRTIETEDQERWEAHGLAQRIALAKAIGLYGIKKIFSFHNRVASASEFVDANRTDSLPAVLDKMSPNLHYSAKHINGEMSAGTRNRILREFKMSARGVISNARCLGEGVNVPVVDGVFFADSRSSVVDIVQATGRALRVVPGKSRAYVIIPVLVQEEEDPETIIEASRFQLVWQVLSAMASQDERVEGAIREARIRQGEGRAPLLGQTHVTDRQDLPDANTFLIGFPKHIAFSEYQSLFSLEMMEQLGTRWHLRFGALKKYMEEHGQEPDQDTEYEGFKIGKWLLAQRATFKKGKLSEDREELLEQLGVQWGEYRDTERNWVRHMAACSTYLDETGKLPVLGEESSDGLKIGLWLTHQRRLFKKGHLREDRKNNLERLLGKVLEPQKARWERNLAAYKGYVEKTGKQPERRTVHEGVAIGNWLINTIRPQKNKLSTELVGKLDALGFVWEAGRKKQAARGSTDSWFKYFESCRFLMRTLGRKVVITDTFRGVNVGHWFQMESQIYAAGAFSDFKRLLFKSLILLDENHGRVLNEWFWNYSHCLEFVLSKSSALTNEYSYHGLPLGEWFGKQVSLMESGALLARQEDAMKELLTIIRDRESTDSPSV